VQARFTGRRATVCNGHAELCSKSYGAVSYVGAHDSYSVGSDNIATNQDYDVTQQLKDGVRMLQNQVHQSSDGLHLCHSNCLLYDAGLASAYLAKVKTFLDANPNEVVTILFVNIDNVAVSSYQALYKAAGLDTLSYSPPAAVTTAGNWPTLGSMIDAGTRLVTFMDNGANFATVPYIIDEFSNVWETPFDVTDQNFPCTVNRSSGDPSTQLYLINHFLDTFVSTPVGTTIAPNKALLNETNAVTGFGSLGADASNCATVNGGRNPTFLLVDFYEYGGGSVFQVAAQLNGVTYSPATPIATPNPPDNSSDTNGTPSSSAGAAPVWATLWATWWMASGVVLIVVANKQAF